jgi:hypothetical protein
MSAAIASGQDQGVNFISTEVFSTAICLILLPDELLHTLWTIVVGASRTVGIKDRNQTVLVPQISILSFSPFELSPTYQSLDTHPTTESRFGAFPMISAYAFSAITDFSYNSLLLI